MEWEICLAVVPLLIIVVIIVLPIIAIVRSQRAVGLSARLDRLEDEVVRLRRAVEQMPGGRVPGEAGRPKTEAVTAPRPQAGPGAPRARPPPAPRPAPPAPAGVVTRPG